MEMNDADMGFGTHNGWLAFRGWLGAKIYGATVVWEVKRKIGMRDYHIVKVKQRVC